MSWMSWAEDVLSPFLTKSLCFMMGHCHFERFVFNILLLFIYSFSFTFKGFRLLQMQFLCSCLFFHFFSLATNSPRDIQRLIKLSHLSTSCSALLIRVKSFPSSSLTQTRSSSVCILHLTKEELPYTLDIYKSVQRNVQMRWKGFLATTSCKQGREESPKQCR